MQVDIFPLLGLFRALPAPPPYTTEGNPMLPPLLFVSRSGESSLFSSGAHQPSPHFASNFSFPFFFYNVTSFSTSILIVHRGQVLPPPARFETLSFPGFFAEERPILFFVPL